MAQTTAVSRPARQPGVISSILFDQKYEMPKHTTREQEFARIDPNEARQLPRGEAFVISGGRAQRVSFNKIDLSDGSLENARMDIARRRASVSTPRGGKGHHPAAAILGSASSRSDDHSELDF